VATKPISEKLDLLIEPQLTSEDISTIKLEYPLDKSMSLFTGWQSAPLTKDVDTSDGTFGVGLRYRKTFPGLNLLPPRR